MLTAMGLPAEIKDSALRFSLCPDTTMEDIDYAADAAIKHYGLLRRYVRR